MTIGYRIKQLRKSNKMSQMAFSRVLSTSSGHISEIETGKKLPGSDFLLSLKRGFSVSVDWVLTGDGEMLDSEKAKSGENNVIGIDAQHNEVIQKFKDKPRARQANIDLLDIENLDRETFIEVVGHIGGIATNLRKTKAAQGEHRPGAKAKKKVNG